jgi:drug/metabolite transporter (DMT)-like permease
MDRTQRDGLLFIVLAAAGYAFFPMFTKVIYNAGLSSPLDILTWRFWLAAPLTWLLIARLPASGEKLPRGHLLALGALFAFVALCAFAALSRLPASLYTVLLYTYPALVALGSLWFGEPLAARGWLALGLTALGVVLTVPNLFSGFGGIDSLGLLLAFGNAVTYAAYIVLSGRLVRGIRDMKRASAWGIAGSWLFVTGMFAVRGVTPPPTGAAWLGLIGLVLVATIVPIFAFYAGMQRLGSARAAILSTIEPVMTLLWAFLLLRETIQPVQLLGAAFILGSVILLQLRPTSPKRKRPIEAAAQG